MPSTVKPSQICATVVQGTASLCARFKTLLSLPTLLCTWFSYVYGEDGVFTDEFKADIDASGIGMPIGGIIFWAAPTLPDGWLICNGQQVSRTTYANLYALWGTLHGAGNGSTTFTLPNMQGRVPLGSGQSSATSPNYVFNITGGEDEHILLDTEIPAHTHSIRTRKTESAEYNDAEGRQEIFEAYNSGTDTVSGTIVGNAPLYSTKDTNPSSGVGAAHENMMPFLAGYWVVRAK